MNFILSLLLTTLFIFPQQKTLTEDFENLHLSSQNYILYSVDSDSVVASQHRDKKIAAASINKVLTTITALDLLKGENLDKEIEVDPIIFSSLSPIASTAGLYAYQTISLREVLYGIILDSGADAANLISYYLTGEVDGLVAHMNKKAKEIGMIDTFMKNTNGLDAQGQHTTLNDLLALLKYALQNEDFVDIYTKEYHQLKNDPSNTFNNHILSAVKRKNFPLIYGAKSGYTSLALYSLSSIASNGEYDYLFISTQAKGEDYTDNFAIDDAIDVYEYMFDHFYTIDLIEEGSLKDQFKIKNRLKEYEIFYKQDVKAMVSDGFIDANLKHEFVYEEDLKAPLEAGTKLGEHRIFYEDELVYEETIFAEKDIPRSFLFQTLYLGSILLVILVILFFILFLIGRIRTYFRRKKARF